MSDIDTIELATLHQNAQPGIWRHDGGDIYELLAHRKHWRFITSVDQAEHAALIAAAVNALPELIASHRTAIHFEELAAARGRVITALCDAAGLTHDEVIALVEGGGGE
jgi:hypothetical protein